MSDNHMDDHLHDQRYENAMFLMNDCGLDLDQAARRIGVTYAALEKLLRKRGWTQERTL